MEERKQREEKSVGAAILEGSFAEAFSSMTDPRLGRTREHLLFDIIVIGVCAVCAE